MTNRRSISAVLTTSVFVGSVLMGSGCGGGSGGGSPTAPADQQLVLSSAAVMVNGQAINGQTLPQGHGEGAAARFEAMLRQGGTSALGHTVWVSYERPMGSGPGPHHGQFLLYDDGTHGDQVAGDGIYCFEDFEGQYGCHRNNAEPGEYHYEFWGEHAHDGHHSNHLGVSVTITGN